MHVNKTIACSVNETVDTGVRGRVRDNGMKKYTQLRTCNGLDYVLQRKNSLFHRENMN